MNKNNTKKNKSKKDKPGIIQSIITDIIVWILILGFLILYGIKWVIWDFMILIIIKNIIKFIKKFYKNIIISIIIIIIISLIYNKVNYQEQLYNTQSTQLQNIQNELNNIQQNINNLQENVNTLESNLNTYKEQIDKTQTDLDDKIDTLDTKVKNVSSRRSNSLTESYTQQPVETVDNSVDNSTEDVEYITFNVSAYCGCKECSEGWGNQTASGATPVQGITIAAGSQYPFGTKIHLEGLGTYIVQDRGGAIKGNKIDVYFDSHSACNNFGRQYIKGYVVK